MPQLIATVQGVEVKHVHLHKKRTTLGRKADNDIVLDNMVVSGEHCVFELEGLADVYLQDLGSTNGTYVNDRMVKERTRLHDGDVIAIGPYRIKYLQASEEPTASSFGETQAFMLGGEKRVSRRAKLITENYLITWRDDVYDYGGDFSNPTPVVTRETRAMGLLGGGIRLFGERMAGDLGLGVAVGDTDFHCCIPLVNFVYNFGASR